MILEISSLQITNIVFRFEINFIYFFKNFMCINHRFYNINQNVKEQEIIPFKLLLITNGLFIINFIFKLHYICAKTIQNYEHYLSEKNLVSDFRLTYYIYIYLLSHAKYHKKY